MKSLLFWIATFTSLIASQSCESAREINILDISFLTKLISGSIDLQTNICGGEKCLLDW